MLFLFLIKQLSLALADLAVELPILLGRKPCGIFEYAAKMCRCHKARLPCHIRDAVVRLFYQALCRLDPNPVDVFHQAQIDCFLEQSTQIIGTDIEFFCDAGECKFFRIMQRIPARVKSAGTSGRPGCLPGSGWSHLPGSSIHRRGSASAPPPAWWPGC